MKNVNIGKWETTINNAIIEYAKKEGLKIKVSRYFDNLIVINDEYFKLDNYKIVNDEIIGNFKKYVDYK